MPKLIQKTLHKWKEPRVFHDICKAIAIDNKNWFQRNRISIFSSLILSSLLILIWFQAKQDPQKNPPPTAIVIPAILVTSLGITYLPIAVARAYSPRVRILEKIVRREGAQSVQVWNFDDIDSFRFDILEYAGKSVGILVLEQTGKLPAIFGIENESDIEIIEHTLLHLGVNKQNES